ncbi:hypothetical protein C8J56DRAFT_1165367 [Mycena floridula]|nr:hypothetical protein C8J56DRAFT_1165367 [Mycena floridula]
MAPCTGNCKNCCSLQSPPSFQSLDPSRDEEVLSLLRSNTSSIGSISESSIMSLAEKDLVDCTSQIRLHEKERIRLDGILMSLRNQKKSLERLGTVCEALTAPIRRMPAEVLRNIFVLLEAESKMAGPETRIEGFQVAAVSHHWRNVALSTKQLWTKIRLVHQGSSNRAEQLQVLDRILQLSGSHPLSLTISGPNPDIQLASRLCMESHRWIRAVFKGYYRLPIWNNPATSLLPNIDHLVVSIDTVTRKPSPVRSTPKLHTLEVDGALLTEWRHLQSRIPPPVIWISQDALTWTPVRQLILTLTPLDLMLDIICKCPNLTSATIKTCELLSLAVSPASSNYKSSLTTLSLVDCPTAIVDGLFQQVDFPQLTSLTIKGSPSDSADDSSFPFTAFASMLHRTKAKLQSLTLDNLTIPTSDQLFELVPSLTSLTVESTTGLISDSILNQMDTHRELPGRVLLPNLDSLTLRLISGFTARAFVEMVQSRWLVTTMARHVAGLKNVVVNVEFQLADQDLRPLKVLKAAGMDITLSDSRGLVSLDTGDEE